MSCFVCSDEHISTLIQYAARENVYYTTLGEAGLSVNIAHNPKATAEILFKENLRSFSHRYPKEAGECGYQYIERTLPEPDALSITKLCSCYDYQACENDDYERTEAAAIINKIRAHASCSLPGWEKARWAI